MSRPQQPRSNYMFFSAPIDSHGILPLTLEEALDDCAIEEWSLDPVILDWRSIRSERTIRPPPAPPSTRVGSVELSEEANREKTRVSSFSSMESVPSMVEDYSGISDSDIEPFPEDRRREMATVRPELCRAIPTQTEAETSATYHRPWSRDPIQPPAPPPSPAYSPQQQPVRPQSRARPRPSLSEPAQRPSLQLSSGCNLQQQTAHRLPKSRSRPCLSNPAQAAPLLPSPVGSPPQKYVNTHLRTRHQIILSNPVLPPPLPPPSLPLPAPPPQSIRIPQVKTSYRGPTGGILTPVPDLPTCIAPLHRSHAQRSARGGPISSKSLPPSPKEQVERPHIVTPSKRSKSQPPVQASPRRRQQVYRDAPSYRMRERPSTTPAATDEPYSFHTTPPLPYVVERSVFEYDTEDESPCRRRAASSPLSSSLAAKLHIRNLSLGSKRIGFGGKKDKNGHKAGLESHGRRRSATQIVMGVLGLGKK